MGIRSFLLITSLVATACHAEGSSTPPPDAIEIHANANAELEDHYRLALQTFNRGAYDDAADQFAQLVLRVPRDPSGDQLRHLFVQHLGWSLLGAYDMSGDASKLDTGEAMLERYLVEHEQLFPAATGERVEIYDLLGQYALRRDGQAPADVNALLQTLVGETQANLERPAPRRHPSNEDLMVREVDVHTQRFASLDDPRVQAWFRDPRYTGRSLFEVSKPANPTRVLVRGWVGDPLRASSSAKHRTWDTLRAARPALEQCYTQALGRGASTVERLAIEMQWDARSGADIQITEETLHDTDTARCIVDALHAADSSEVDDGELGRAELRLTFFVQPPRSGPRVGGYITRGAMIEDVEFVPLTARASNVNQLFAQPGVAGVAAMQFMPTEVQHDLR